MPKIRSFLNPSGKMDKLVFVDSSKYGNHTRKAPRPGLKKDEPALKRQNSRTKLLNDLAGDLNRAFRSIWPAKKSDLYQKMLKRFRKEPMNSRGLLLMRLESMDLNPRYLLNSLGTRATEVKVLDNEISIDLQVNSHPPPGKYNADRYYYEVILFTWSENNNKASWSWQYSDWINLGPDKPGFEFLFPKPPGILQWLLCLRIHLAIGEFEIPALVATGMQITDVGTCDPGELMLLEQRKFAENAEKQPMPKPNEVERVKATRIIR